MHSSGDSRGAPDFQKVAGSGREEEAAPNGSPGPWSLEGTLGLPGKADLERREKQQAGVGAVGGWVGAGATPGEIQPLRASPAARLPHEKRPVAAERPPFSDTPVDLRGGRRTHLAFNKFSNKQVVRSFCGSICAEPAGGDASPLACGGNQNPRALRQDPCSVRFLSLFF